MNKIQIMKKIFIFLLFFVSTNLCFSQIDHIRVLIGKTESEVRHYLDSLNSLKSNPYYKIKENVSVNGNLYLECGYSIFDEEYYTCTFLLVGFQRFSGTEVCTNQTISGSVEYAQSNLSFIKDNFKLVSAQRWENPFSSSNKFKMVATFERREGDYPVYVIDYFVEEVK